MDKPPEVTQAEWNAIVASDMTFTEIAAKWGKEVAIEAGIVRDPDAPELTAEDFARARPAVEVDREFVERWRRARGKQQKPIKQRVSIRLDADITEHFRSSGPGWQTRLNDTLRRAVFGS
jgi:uncharacterized protein (DUF4415 family)